MKPAPLSYKLQVCCTIPELVLQQKQCKMSSERTDEEPVLANRPHMRAEANLESTEPSVAHRIFAIRVLSYLTNHVIRRIPSFTLRHAWYRHVLGIKLASGAVVHLGCFVWVYGPRQIRREIISIGANTRINRDCCLDLRGGLYIGENVSISPEVMILTAGHNVNNPDFRVETRRVVIEDHVYIGSRAMILPGVTLGRGSVVGAASVVTRDVPSLAIVAGAPARPVRVRPEDSTHYVLDEPVALLE
jgi:acetyltransferase-like isoleucine patch superfamily enzyme